VELMLAACGYAGVAVKINCNPNRLDLDWRSMRMRTPFANSAWSNEEWRAPARAAYPKPAFPMP